ncbi:MAG: SRPBCC family protein [Deltaproteobacteria bacterium]|nr:SRPBCC family protein [Deltaproteobacteria bacterium]
MPGTSRTIAIAAPMATVFAVLADFESYPDFLPEIQRAQIHAREAGACEVEFAAHIVTDLTYTLHCILDPPQRIQWSLIAGEVMTKNDGGWLLREIPGGTEATYTIDVGFGPFVPRIVTKMLVGSSLPTFLERVKKRAEDEKVKGQ